MIQEKDSSKTWLMIDTSLEKHYFALWKEGVIWQIELEMKESMEMALDALSFWLDSQDKVLKKQISGVMLAIGPGSYTGLRWGYSVACALAFSLKVPVIAFSSFLAYSLENEDSVVLFDARAGGLYSGFVEKEGKLRGLWRLNKAFDENSFDAFLFSHSLPWMSPEAFSIESELKQDNSWPKIDPVIWNPRRWIQAFEAKVADVDVFPFRNIRLEYLKQDHEVPSIRRG